MKKLLIWLKGNPILIVAAILCIAALSSLVIVHFQGAAFVSKMAARSGKISEIQGLTKTKVSLPPEKPGGPPTEITITVNPADIEAIKKIYGRMSDEYVRIFHEANQFNQQGHNILLPRLFPQPSDAEMHLLYQARIDYREAFADMFKYYSRSSLYPRLNAGGPIPLSQLDEAVSRAQAEYLGHFRQAKNLNAVELKELNAKKQLAAIREMTDHASKISVYAESDPTRADYPFEVMNWVNKDEQPNIAEVWEGQMSLWIQQDIVEAIGRTNNIANNDANVMVAPIKRLLGISVGSRYVGLNLQSVSLSAAAAAGAGGGSGAAGAGGAGALVPPDFRQSPTGRVSNEIFDVRHVRVHMLVDWNHISDFMGALARTNFMTVLDVDVLDVDEYEALRAGYMYGTGDVVDVTMIIETLWLREWTKELMPNAVKMAMGIPIPAKPSEQAPPAAPTKR